MLGFGLIKGHKSMKIYLFTNQNRASKDCFRRENISSVLRRAADGTDTSDLVVGVYLLSNNSIWQGHAIREHLGPENFHCHTGRKWAFVRSFEAPRDLPVKYGLIRMAFGTSAHYPKTVKDNYGWKEWIQSFDDHVASLFAHELHHFRRHHLGLHPGEGEQSACKWALQQTEEAGFQVQGHRDRRRKSRKASKKNIRVPSNRNPKLLRRIKMSASHLCPEDLKELENWAYMRSNTVKKQLEKKQSEEHFAKLRSLPDGGIVKITEGEDRWNKYKGQTAIKTGTLRRNSPRLVIRVPDGIELYWPMQWLEVVE